ncbi:hypothetical protein MMC07_009717 [Pseudocyphellaria aurata]|nr:hypothetical protein [Pseudocyphellaria aurata]
MPDPRRWTPALLAAALPLRDLRASDLQQLASGLNDFLAAQQASSEEDPTDSLVYITYHRQAIQARLDLALQAATFIHQITSETNVSLAGAPGLAPAGGMPGQVATSVDAAIQAIATVFRTAPSMHELGGVPSHCFRAGSWKDVWEATRRLQTAVPWAGFKDNLGSVACALHVRTSVDSDGMLDGAPSRFVILSVQPDLLDRV